MRSSFWKLASRKMSLFYAVGKENLPPQNVSLACKLFWAESNWGPKDTESHFLPFPLTCLENLDKGTSSRIHLLPKMLAKITGQVWWGKLGRAQKSASTLRPTCLPNVCFLILISIAPSPLKSQTTTPTCSFGFSWRCYLRWELQPFWWITQFSWVSPMYVVVV